MNRAALVFGLGALVGVLGAGMAGWPRAAMATDPATVARIARNLQTAPTDAVLLAGNSHAAGAADRGPPCAPWVNAGIGGATARSYAAVIDQVPETARVRLAVLLIGSNDILRRDRPLSADSLARFRADSAKILGWLEARAVRVLVAAVPPIGVTATRKRDPAAVAVYSGMLADLCQERGCRFVDPFTALRDGAGGLGRPEALPDGVHLADYPAMLAALDVCGTGEL